MAQQIDRVEHGNFNPLTINHAIQNEVQNQVAERSQSNTHPSNQHRSTPDFLDFSASDIFAGIQSGAVAGSGMIGVTEAVSNANQLIGDISNVVQRNFQQHPFSADQIKKERQCAGFGVEQAGHGDCWFESALAGLVNSPNGASAISSMITRTPDGSYMVTFPGEPLHPIVVTDQDINRDQLRNRAQWAQIIEAALLKRYPVEGQNGGSPSVAISLLTGHHAVNEPTSNDVGERMRSTLRQGGLVEAGTPTANGTVVKGQRTDIPSPLSPLVPHHAYTVVGFDSHGDVIVRNPWGHNYGTSVTFVGDTANGITNIGDGELKMSLSTFQHYFTYVGRQA